MLPPVQRLQKLLSANNKLLIEGSPGGKYIFPSDALVLVNIYLPPGCVIGHFLNRLSKLRFFTSESVSDGNIYSLLGGPLKRNYITATIPKKEPLMPKKKNNMKKKLSEITYNKPSVGKHLMDIKKGLGEVSSMLNEKKK